MNTFEQRIYGTLAGVMYGDSYGMPTEGMSLGQIQKVCPNGVRQLLPSLNSDISTRRYDAGSITDDSIHTFILIDTLNICGGKVDGKRYMQYLKEWYHTDLRADEVIGTSTLNAIKAFEEGRKNLAADYAVTNGCMMKISPVGLLYDNKKDILDAVVEVCQYTHNANIALSSAAVVAYLISSFSRNKNGLEELDNLIFEMLEYSKGTGFDMPSASVAKRIELGNHILKKRLTPGRFMQEVYDLIGTGVYCTETLPAAVTIIKYCHGDMTETAQICASIGGDTDTIASIACAICGSMGALPSGDEIAILERQNTISIRAYTQKIIKLLDKRADIDHMKEKSTI